MAKITQLDLFIGAILMGSLCIAIIGCSIMKNNTHGNGNIEAEAIIQSRIK